MPSEVTRYLSRIGRRGGRSKSAAKLAAVRANLEKAQAARRKYTLCPHYKNRSHRFSPATGRCPCDPLESNDKWACPEWLIGASLAPQPSGITRITASNPKRRGESHGKPRQARPRAEETEKGQTGPREITVSTRSGEARNPAERTAA